MIGRMLAMAMLLACLAVFAAAPAFSQVGGYPTPVPSITETTPPPTTPPPTVPPTTPPPTVPPTTIPPPTVPPLDPPDPPTLAVTGLALGTGAAAAAVLIGGGGALIRATRRNTDEG